MRKEFDLGDSPRMNARPAPSRSRRLDDYDTPNGFAAPEEFDDEYFNVPEPATNGSRKLTIPAEPRTEPAPRRARTPRQMPKRLSEELSEQLLEEGQQEEASTEEVTKQTRARRRYSKQETGEQLPLDLKSKAKKPDTSVKQRQTLGVLLIMCAILITLAVISYSPLDAPQAETKMGDLPAVFTRSDPIVNAHADTVQNWLGLIGSMMADFFINKTIGYASIIFPLLLGAWSLAFFRFTTRQRRKLTIATSFILVSAVLFSATIGTMQLINAFPDIPREWAGAVGQFMGQSFTRLIGSIGSLIIFATSFIVMLVFSVDLDVERTFMRGKEIWEKVLGLVRMKLVEFWDKREAKKAKRLEREAAEAPEEEIEEPTVVKKEKKKLFARNAEEAVSVAAVASAVPDVVVAKQTEPVIEDAPLAEVQDIEEINPARDIISIRREPEVKPEEKTPFLKVRPAPKTGDMKPMNRISKTEGEMLGNGTAARLAKLSAGATGIPSAPRSVRILPTDLEEEKIAPKQEIPSPIVEEKKVDAPVIPLENKITIPIIEEKEEAEVIIGDEKVLADEVLPHSVDEGYRDIIVEHQQASKEMAKEIRAERELITTTAPSLFGEDKPFLPENPYNESLKNYRMPPLEILAPPSADDEIDADNEELTAKGRLLRDKLATFGVEIENITVTPGPVVTLYEFTPAEGVKVSAVGNLTDDIALAMKARGIRIIAPMPGRGTIGIEIPNDHPKMVKMRSVLQSSVFSNSKMNLPVALGKTISGDVYVDDLSKMPHLLIAGATGSGKSVGVNGIITSLLYAKNPRDVKFVVVDPKKIELSLYKALRNHFLFVSPEAGEDIITTPQYAVLALKALEIEMERRYDKLAKAAVRSLADYNAKVAHGKLRSTADEQHYHLPYIVVIIDELADLMITAAREIEEPICRLAQMARAVGIHLILATQRPSVDVITGVIKANFPARIAYQVATKVDSRTILDTMGAEQLLGNGDMLYLPSGTPKPIRLQAPYISTDEVEAVVEAISSQQGQGQSYSRPWTLPSLKQKGGAGGAGDDGERDELFDEAAWTVFRHQQASTSMLQRRLKIGYSRAARIIDELERYGIVSAGDGSKGREVLIDNENEMEVVMRNL
jgi:DNA segregation ATPase FtsK/SpoIIIE-like protein